MPKFLRNIMIGILVCVVLYAPVAVYDIIVSARNINYADAYEKKKIKVDSLAVVAHNYSDGGASSDYYHIYSNEFHRKISFTDHEKSLLNKRSGEDRIIPHLLQYMEQHHDSIQIWYHPKGEIKYARETERGVPIREDSMKLVINSMLLIIAILHVRWQIRYYKDKKQRKKA